MVLKVISFPIQYLGGHLEPTNPDVSVIVFVVAVVLVSPFRLLIYTFYFF